MIRGPVEYIPPVEIEVVTKRSAIPLDVNEGIYIRNVKSGKVVFETCFCRSSEYSFIYFNSLRWMFLKYNEVSLQQLGL